MTNNEVREIFDASFSDVTRKLVRLEVSKVRQPIEQDKNILSQGVRGKIETKGEVNLTVICRFSEPLFRYIIETMHGGTLPIEEEIPLYLNEYMNIICGDAISKINNITKSRSRLSVPSFYGDKDSLEILTGKRSIFFLIYDTEYGKLHVGLFLD